MKKFKEMEGNRRRLMGAAINPFSKIEIPEIEDERIEEITSKYGWTLIGEMSFGKYLEEDLLGISEEKITRYKQCLFLHIID